MKIRSGFVSNSSTSSFVCDVCGEEVSGMDLGISDAGMYSCENGHTFCESHMLPGEKTVDEDGYEDRYDRPECTCPACHMESISTEDLIAYLLKEVGMTKVQIVAKLKEKYQPNGFVPGAYNQFLQDLKS